MSGCNYNGINRLLLEPFNSYLTWNQILDYQKKDKSIKLRKGSKAEIVVYFNFKKGVKDIVAEDGSIEHKVFTDIVDYNALDNYRTFGGIRIEDDVIVTKDGGRVIGGDKKIPVTVEELEAVVGK